MRICDACGELIEGGARKIAVHSPSGAAPGPVGAPVPVQAVPAAPDLPGPEQPMSGFRCTAKTGVHAEIRAMAEKIVTPFGAVDWAPEPVLQCLVEDVDHSFHAAFLRTGTRTDPCSDIYLCWKDGDPDQSLADLDCCMARSRPLDAGCMIFRHHPGRCYEEYIDPPQVAAQAQGDQLLKKLGISLPT
ncbi:hypothetical protein RKD48_001190 [Streptomyces ambofaciens]